MFDPHIYACQPMSSSISGSNSNPTIQSFANENQKPPPSPLSSPQKNNNKHVNSNTVIPVQTPGFEAGTPQLSNVDLNAQNESETPTLNNSSGNNSSNSGEVSRKTSTETFLTADTGHENSSSFLTPKSIEDVPISTTPISSHDPSSVAQSPQRRLSRFLVSPTVVETANHELIVQETPQTNLQSPQLTDNSVEMNLNDDSYQRSDATAEIDMQPQPSTGFRMPETLEQLKIELENITHAHVSTKSKEPISTQPSMSQGPYTENDDSHDPASEAHIESSTADVPSIHDAIGSLNTGENTSVYNSRRTSADMNTNPTDLTSTASGILENDENLVSEPIQDDINAGKLSLNLTAGEK